MTKEELWKAIESVDDDLVEAADDRKGSSAEKTGSSGPASKRHLFKPLLAAAACVVLIAAGWLVLGGRRPAPVPDFDNPIQRTEPQMEQGVVLDHTPVTKNAFYTADFARLLLVYKEHVYVEASRMFRGNELMGERLGYISESIDEWTMRDDFVEQGGIVSGDFFAVKGFSPDLMVAMPVRSGEVVFLVRAEDLILSKGADILENILHLGSRAEGLIYAKGSLSQNEPFFKLEDSQISVVKDLIASLDRAAVYSWKAFEEGEFSGENLLYTLYFTCSDGMTFHGSLYRNGCLSLPYLTRPVYILLSPEEWAPLLYLLETGAGKACESPNLTLSLADARNDPVFGAFVPESLPEDLHLGSVSVSYEIEPGTGAFMPARSMVIELERENLQGISLEYGYREDYIRNIRHGVVLQPEDLTAEAIRELQEKHSYFLGLALSNNLLVQTYIDPEIITAEEAYDLFMRTIR